MYLSFVIQSISLKNSILLKRRFVNPLTEISSHGIILHDKIFVKIALWTNKKGMVIIL